jgi:hypothetical protein
MRMGSKLPSLLSLILVYLGFYGEVEPTEQKGPCGALVGAQECVWLS